MKLENIGLKILLTGIIILTISAFWWIGQALFAGPPTMICKDGKIYLKEMGYDIYRESPNVKPCFNSQELLK